MEAVSQSIGAGALDVSGRLGPVSPAALVCKGLFSPICASFGLIRPGFRPIGPLFGRCGTLAQGCRGGFEGSDKAADTG
jgi:hypothetical protein